MKKAVVFMGMGFELLGLVMGAWVIGRQVDQYFHWNGYAMGGFILAVMLGWMYHLIVLLKRLMEDVDSDDTDNMKS